MSGTRKTSSGQELGDAAGAGKTAVMARLAGLDRLVSELFAASEAVRYGFSQPVFAGLLAEALNKYLEPDCDDSRLREFLSALHVQELVLARACAAGNQTAWDAFLSRFREPLYEAGIAIAKDYVAGRELADSLYADLCGAGSHGTTPLNSYMGYGSLEGWLRTIMARSFIDRYRSEHRLISLEEEAEDGMQLAAPALEQPATVDARLEEAIDEALSDLDAEERYILASFFLHDRTLAEISRVLKLHESTVSRRIQKITVDIRKQIIKGMMRRGMTRRQADEALVTDVRDLRTDVRAHLQENLQDGKTIPSPTQGSDTAKVDDDC